MSVRRSLVALPAASMLATPAADACARAVHEGPDGRYPAGRTMDWKEDTRTNLWALPRGVARDGAAGATSLRWTSSHGSLAATGHDIATADGLDEAGLMVSGQRMTESV